VPDRGDDLIVPVLVVLELDNPAVVPADARRPVDG
jgi:hypothetical protein